MERILRFSEDCENQMFSNSKNYFLKSSKFFPFFISPSFLIFNCFIFCFCEVLWNSDGFSYCCTQFSGLLRSNIDNAGLVVTCQVTTRFLVSLGCERNEQPLNSFCFPPPQNTKRCSADMSSMFRFPTWIWQELLTLQFSTEKKQFRIDKIFIIVIFSTSFSLFDEISKFK